MFNAKRSVNKIEKSVLRGPSNQKPYATIYLVLRMTDMCETLSKGHQATIDESERRATLERHVFGVNPLGV